MQQAIASDPIAINIQPQAERPIFCPKLKILLAMFNISLRELANGSGRSVSRSQIHRIIRGKRPSPVERRAIAVGLMECLRSRCDSSFLFE